MNHGFKEIVNISKNFNWLDLFVTINIMDLCFMKQEASNDADAADYVYLAWVKNKLQKKLFACRSV